MPPADVVDSLRAAGCVYAEHEAALLVAAAASPADIADLVSRRVAGAPLEHVLGWAELSGHRIAVSPGVFVPRRRTELLVAEALSAAPPEGVVVDLCCGSGAVAAVLAVALPDVELHAVDIDPAAVTCARGNLERGQVHEGDLYAALPPDLRGRIDVIVANAPYVPSAAIPLLPAEARLHEARVALDGGSDGLDVQRRVVAEAPAWLAPGGRLLVETSNRQAPRTVALFTRSGLRARRAVSTELDVTVVVGVRPDDTQ